MLSHKERRKKHMFRISRFVYFERQDDNVVHHWMLVACSSLFSRLEWAWEYFLQERDSPCPWISMGSRFNRVQFCLPEKAESLHDH